MDRRDRPLVWLHGEVKTPPFSQAGRIEAGVLLRRLQRSERLGLPHSRPMPGVGPRCHELRIQDEQVSWRVVYRIDPDAIVVAAVFAKKTQHTPQSVIVESRRRLRRYDAATGEGDRG
jgi:phage-related protein